MKVWPLVVLLAATALAGCSSEIAKHENVYLNNDQTIAPTQVPAQYGALHPRSYFPVSNDYQRNAPAPSKVPPGSQMLSARQALRDVHNTPHLS